MVARRSPTSGLRYDSLGVDRDAALGAPVAQLITVLVPVLNPCNIKVVAQLNCLPLTFTRNKLCSSFTFQCRVPDQAMNPTLIM